MNSQLCPPVPSQNPKVIPEPHLSWNLGPTSIKMTLGKSLNIYELQFLIHNIGLMVPISRVVM